MKRCENGHYYDPEKYGECPSCGMNEIEIDATRKVMPSNTQLEDSQGEETRAIMHKKSGYDPVVGWLICIEGADKGRDYRLHTERNFIGRDPTMDVCISGDNTIARHKHAILSFNPRKNSYRLAPGDTRGMIYLNDEEVDMPQTLNAYDVIEIGETKLLFMPLCGERFQWEK
jgi:hypothetical protein